MNILLDGVEARVLGALIEKDITTPEYYPLSINALVNACNQKSNRDPVMELGEDAVRQALHSLAEKGLAGASRGGDHRVTKYEHQLQEVFNFNRLETAIICELLLRGPQTPGELRSHTERMHHSEELGEVLSTLQRLMERQPPLVKMLARQPGTKEARYAHLLSGDVEPRVATASPNPPAAGNSANTERVTRLEDQVANLQQEMTELRAQFANFRKQFE
jgi:uncharacterized protein